MAQGFIAIAAAQAAAAGASLDEVAKAAKAMIPRVNLYATLETLQYLARSGRVPAALALLGAALQVQPVFTIKNGTVDLIARVRTRTRAIEHIVECVAAHLDGGALHAAVFHADVPHDAEALAQELHQHFACRELLTTEFTPVMGTHTGPGTLGVAFYSE
jgi:DegV family protein with EDD domain